MPNLPELHRAPDRRPPGGRFTAHWALLAGAALRGLLEVVALWRARSGRGDGGRAS